MLGKIAPVKLSNDKPVVDEKTPVLARLPEEINSIPAEFQKWVVS